MAIGTATKAPIHPREVFQGALLLNATAIIVAHNHPSDKAEPSAADIQVTKRLKEVGEIIGIELLDHVILVADGYYSLCENNIL